MNNDHFDEGREALAAWASTWPACGAPLLSKRHFMLLEPTPLDQLEAAPDLEQTIDRAMAQEIPERTARPPWWKRIFSGS